MHPQLNPAGCSTVGISPYPSLPWCHSYHQVNFLLDLPLYFPLLLSPYETKDFRVLKIALWPTWVCSEDLLEGYFPWVTLGLWSSMSQEYWPPAPSGLVRWSSSRLAVSESQLSTPCNGNIFIHIEGIDEVIPDWEQVQETKIWVLPLLIMAGLRVHVGS